MEEMVSNPDLQSTTSRVYVRELDFKVHLLSLSGGVHITTRNGEPVYYANSESTVQTTLHAGADKSASILGAVRTPGVSRLSHLGVGKDPDAWDAVADLVHEGSMSSPAYSLLLPNGKHYRWERALMCYHVVNCETGAVVALFAADAPHEIGAFVANGRRGKLAFVEAVDAEDELWLVLACLGVCERIKRYGAGDAVDIGDEARRRANAMIADRFYLGGL